MVGRHKRPHLSAIRVEGCPPRIAACAHYPPELTLEVDLGPTGKRVLHIGRREGESMRYYARLPDDKTGAVFILSEEDGQKIVRDLKGFAK